GERGGGESGGGGGLVRGWVGVLMRGDVEDDALLVLRELRRGGFHPSHERHDTSATVADALARAPWDIVISDYTMPQLDALAVIRLVRESGRDIPVIIVSGTIGEGTARLALKARA